MEKTIELNRELTRDHKTEKSPSTIIVRTIYRESKHLASNEGEFIPLSESAENEDMSRLNTSNSPTIP